MTQAKIALISYDSLGDGMLYLMMAYNLYSNGYEVDYYNNFATGLSAWIPGINIHKLPDHDGILALKNSHDLVILDPPSFMRARLDFESMPSELQGIALINQKLPPAWRGEFRSSFTDDKLKQLAFSDTLRDRTANGETMVELYEYYMRYKIKLKNVSKHVPFVLPEHVVKHRYANRIVIFPFSRSKKKCWSTKGFIKLYKKLEQEGLEPVMVVAPNEVEGWKKESGDFPCYSNFPTIVELAEFLYESAAVVANDSGGGHLASILGISTVSIYKKSSKKYIWRPGWAKSYVVTPKVSPVIFSNRIWHPFISLQEIVTKVKSCIEANNTNQPSRLTC